MRPEVLYFVVRSDLTPGRQAAQLIHAMDLWCEANGPQRGTVIVYQTGSERSLLRIWEERVREDGVIFHEPDLEGEATAFATPRGPLRLPLLR